MRPDPVPATCVRRRPRWLPPLATVIGFALTAAAGNWQLDRAHEKERLQRAYDRGAVAAPIHLTALPAGAEDLRMSRVEVEGEFVSSGMALLDNKTRGGVAGYEVVMPLRIRGSSMHVLINRGWIAAGPERSRLPTFFTPEAAVKVTGMAMVPGRFIELSSVEESGPVWQNLTVARYVARTGLEVQPVVVQQQNELDDGLVRLWERPDFGVTKHYGYAVQWFIFCGLIIFLYSFFHVKSSRSKKHQEDAPPPGSD
ncbi:MAG: SURF1 family protein [Prolixibacteraceae bacterium]|nr:SURF1 family protein [Burkholderiales bacterium]